MNIENCDNCGGTHFGSYECPYIKASCAVCGEATVTACSDCAIETGKSVHICTKGECRDKHELKHTKAGCPAEEPN